jgi:hypothetical protein
MTFTEELIDKCREEMAFYRAELVSCNRETIDKISNKMNILREVITVSLEYPITDENKTSYNEIRAIIGGLRNVTQEHTLGLMMSKISIFIDDITFTSWSNRQT